MAACSPVVRLDVPRLRRSTDVPAFPGPARTPSGAWPVIYNRRAAQRFSAAHPHGLPPGARSPDHPEAVPSVPVVLVHGTNGRSSCDWFTLAPLLANRGHHVYPFDWRRRAAGPEDPSATHVHALQLAQFIDRVRESTGADRVDLVAHSWGAVLAEYLMRCLPEQPAAGAVRRLVGVAPTYGGTTLMGLAAHHQRLPDRTRHWLDSKIPTWSEQLPGSAVLSAIAAAPPAFPQVAHTIIVTRHDRVVTPYKASLTAVPEATRVVLQDHDCRARVGHLGILHHRAALALVPRALRHPIPRTKATT